MYAIWPIKLAGLPVALDSNLPVSIAAYTENFLPRMLRESSADQLSTIFL